tara:strand:+ start:717 stop:1214 length:498 start_codon:yes stop_codon:yes gene_type:complete
MENSSLILDQLNIDKKITRIAWEIYEDNIQHDTIYLIGICGRGEILASKLGEEISKISSIKVNLVVLNINKDNPIEVNLSFDLKSLSNKVVVLVDDVLNTGKTLMYSCQFLLTINLLKLNTVVLVERLHNNYPIKANYVGLSLATTLQNYVTVILEGNRKGVYLS